MLFSQFTETTVRHKFNPLVLSKRVHFFELQDLETCPPFLRNLITETLALGWRLTGAADAVVPILANALSKTRQTTVIDLCAGGGGPTPCIIEALNRFSHQIRYKAVLTDLFPNLPAWEKIVACSGQLTFERSRCDATSMPERLDGFRTMFLSFHHFAPDAARQILADAVRKRQGIAVFELQNRHLSSVLGLLFFGTLFIVFVSLFVRPLNFRRILLTLIIPLIPVFCVFDGVVSALRTYTVDEMNSMLQQLRNEEPAAKDYTWSVKMGTCGIMGLVEMTYLIGYPAAD